MVLQLRCLCYETRNGSNTIRLKIHDTELAAASVLIRGAKLWNKLIHYDKTITTRKNFRTKITSDVINLYSDV